jgi:hypothetical protein
MVDKEAYYVRDAVEELRVTWNQAGGVEFVEAREGDDDCCVDCFVTFGAAWERDGSDCLFDRFEGLGDPFEWHDGLLGLIDWLVSGLL